MASLIAVLADELEESTCRCCLSKTGSKDIDSVYYRSGEKEVYGDMLLQTFGIKLFVSDEAVSACSKLICDECVERLRDAARFKVQVMDCEEQFTRLFARRSRESECYENQEDTSCKQTSLLDEMIIDDDMSVEYLEEDTDENVDYLENDESQNTKSEHLEISNENLMPEETEDDADRIQIKEENLSGDEKYEVEALDDSDAESLEDGRQNNPEEFWEKMVKPSADRREEPPSEDPLSPNSSILRNLLMKPAEATEEKKTEFPTAGPRLMSKFLEDPKVREKFIKAFLAEPKVRMKSKKYSVRKPPDAQKSNPETQTERREITQGIKRLLLRSRFDSKAITRNAELIIKYTTAYPFRLLNNLMRCAYCYDTFPTADLWREHVESEHPDSASSDFVHRGKRYERIRVDIKVLRCRICSAEAEDLSDIVDHLIDKHNKTLNRKYDFGVMPFKIIHDEMACLICGERHPTLLRLATHVGRHFEDFVCGTCGKGFSKLEHLYLHRKEHASEFRCTKCEINFDTHQDLKAHMKMHPARRKCNICGEVFKYYPERLKHMIEKHNYPAPVYKCNVCSITFDKKRAYQWHNFNHHAPTPFECEYCGARFVRETLLNLHLVKHTRDRNHHCDICGKTFPRKSSLRIHQRIHANDRRYMCQFCKLQFVQRTSLMFHLRKHHNQVEA